MVLQMPVFICTDLLLALDVVMTTLLEYLDLLESFVCIYYFGGKGAHATCARGMCPPYTHTLP